MAEKMTTEQFGQSIKAKHPEYKDMDDATVGKAVLAKYPQYADIVHDPSFNERLTAVTPHQAIHSFSDAGREGVTALRNIGAGGISAIEQPFVHPIDTLNSAWRMSPPGAMMDIVRGKPTLAEETAKSVVAHPLESLEQGAGGIAGGAVLGEGLGMAAKGGSALRSAAIGDPNVPALKGLRIPPSSPKSLRTVSAVEGARPFLKGATNLEDLQGKIPAAKTEIWNPYKQTVGQISGKQVTGPDGPTTIGELEAERKQLSALNRDLRAKDPQAIQTAQQKGMSQAQLLDREKAVQAALDPHLEQAGIDPKAIRQAFGQVATVEGRVAGRSTLAEPSQPYGLSKLRDVSLTKPLSNIPLAGDIGRDLAAGRYFSAKPTDVNLREAFRTGGEKPDFRAPSSAIPPFENPPRQLPSSTIGNADFGDDYTQGGFPAQPVRTGQAPPSRLALPADSDAAWQDANTQMGKLGLNIPPREAQPMIGVLKHPGAQRSFAPETTRVAPPEFLPPSKPMPSTGTRTVTPDGTVGPPAPRGLLPGAQETVAPPEPTTAPVYPPGSAYRHLPMETPVYPAGSQFRKIQSPFDIDQYLKGQQ